VSDKGLGQLGRLTCGEQLLIDRRRRGETQEEAADRYGVSRFCYGNWERDCDDGAPKVKVKALQGYERCLLYRHRCEMTQSKVATDIKRSRHWVNSMECGKVPCDELIWYWEQ
jgi:DNA-binding XRE family transcriptional regulator